MTKRIKKFIEDLEKILDDTNFVNPEAGELCIDEIDDEDEVAHGDGSNTPSDVDYSSMRPEERPEQDYMDYEDYDKYIGAVVMMDVPGERLRRATVKRRVKNNDGTSAGTHHRNPLMDTREYELEYDDGTHDHYFANVIAENLYSQIE